MYETFYQGNHCGELKQITSEDFPIVNWQDYRLSLIVGNLSELLLMMFRSKLVMLYLVNFRIESLLTSVML